MNNNLTKIIQKWKENEIITEEDLDNALENFQVLFAYNTNKIEIPEITIHDTREVFENGKIMNYTGDIKNLFAINNQKECYYFLKKKIINKEKLSIDLIKQLHRELIHGTYDERRYNRGERPGEFKHHDYIVCQGIGSYPEDVEKDLSELIDEINAIEITDKNFLKIDAYFHVVFENIHPFADGNGRVGRTLINYINMINGLPPLIIFDNDKNLYYECLGKYDTDEDIEPLSKFFEYELENTWKRELLKVKSRQYKKSLTEQMSQLETKKETVLKSKSDDLEI